MAPRLCSGADGSLSARRVLPLVGTGCTPVEARAIQGVTCRFRTAFATEVLPLALNGLDYSVKGDGALLSLRLGMSADGHLGEVELSKLRLHLAGERYISQLLYLGLLRHLGGIQLVLLDGEGKPLKEYVESFEKMLIDNTMRRHKGSIAAVMDELCLPRRTLNEKMAKYGLQRQDYT